MLGDLWFKGFVLLSHASRSPTAMLRSCSCSLGVLMPSCPAAGTCLIPRPASGGTSWGWEVSRAGDTVLLVMSLVPHPRDTPETGA